MNAVELALKAVGEYIAAQGGNDQLATYAWLKCRAAGMYASLLPVNEWDMDYAAKVYEHLSA